MLHHHLSLQAALHEGARRVKYVRNVVEGEGVDVGTYQRHVLAVEQEN